MEHWGAGDIFPATVVALVILSPILHFALERYSDWRYEQDVKLLLKARAMELGEGVTLFRAARAYFGEDGIWLPGSDAIIVDGPLDDHFPGALLCVNPKTWELEISEIGHDSVPADRDRLDALVRDMIRAAKDKENLPKA
ncbi:MAG: hypothetical protein K2K53_06795 [Oscillospiraceae bacterium]|nr:hypothetical protein [Oscillospiraceae bacterium]